MLPVGSYECEGHKEKERGSAHTTRLKSDGMWDCNITRDVCRRYFLSGGIEIASEFCQNVAMPTACLSEASARLKHGQFSTALQGPMNGLGWAVEAFWAHE